jgi:hypothetical protein
VSKLQAENPSAWAKLEAAGFLNEAGSYLSWRALADGIAAFLEEGGHVAESNDADEVENKIATYEAITVGVFDVSEIDRDLRDLVRDCGRTGAGSYVQQALSDGLVLLSGPKTETITNPDGAIQTVVRRGLYLTKNEEVLSERFRAPRLNSIVQHAERVNNDLGMAEEKVPALKATRQAAIEAAMEKTRKALPAAPTNAAE